MQNIPLKIAAIYALAGALWILLSDLLLQLLVVDPALITRLSMLKGWLFIAITAVVLYRLVSRDHAEVRRSSETIREQEELLRNVLETLPVGVWLIDREGKITHGNPAGQRIWGGARFIGIEQFGDYKGWLLATGKRIEALEWGAARAIREGETSLGEEIEIEGFDGIRRIILHSAAPLRNRENGIVGAVVVNEDITARKRMERENATYQDKLRFMAAEMSLVEERERRQLATALHDQIGQVLAMAKIKLGALKNVVSVDECHRSADEIRELLEQAINSSRSLTFELSPPVLYELGFETALQALCEKFQQRHGLRIEFVTDREPKPLADDMRILLFRAVQELLVNVVKHARAGSVRISCKRDDARMFIVVADDGSGFDQSAAGARFRDGFGFGLFSIRERLHYLGGEMTVDSVPGRGTRVTLTAQLQETVKEGSPS